MLFYFIFNCLFCFVLFSSVFYLNYSIVSKPANVSDWEEELWERSLSSPLCLPRASNEYQTFFHYFFLFFFCYVFFQLPLFLFDINEIWK